MIETAVPLGNSHRTGWMAMSCRWAMAAAFTMSLGGCKDVFFAAVNTVDSSRNVAVHSGLEFDPQHQLNLDVYGPGDAQNAPVVVFFYGGSWEDGKRRWYRYVGNTLARNGIVTFIPDYRKFPDVRFPAFVKDAATAVQWVHEHAIEFGGDPSRIFVMGHSAGGQIAALVACDDRYLAGVGMHIGELAGMIGLAGAYDFLPFVEDEPEIFGSSKSDKHDSQPINFVNESEPPLLLLQGEDDDEVEPSNAKHMAARAQKVGARAELKLYPGVGHASIILSMARSQAHSPALADILSFVHETGAPARAGGAP